MDSWWHFLWGCLAAWLIYSLTYQLSGTMRALASFKHGYKPSYDVEDTASDALDAANDAKSTAQAAADAATDAKDAAEGAQLAARGLTTLVYSAIGASLIAALAAIISLMQISRARAHGVGRRF